MNTHTLSLLLLVNALLLAACSSMPPQSHEYSLLLDGLPASGNADVEKTETLNIRRIDLPDFLQTRALVMQVTSNEIVMARYHSWADRLDDSIAEVLELALVAERPQISIVDASNVACHLDIRFDRFHAAAEGQVLSSGEYSLGIDDTVTTRRFDVSRDLPVGGYASAVGELRKSLTDLASELSELIEAAGGCDGQ